MNYIEEYEALKTALTEALPEFHIVGTFSNFCPEHQFIRVDFLDRADWPHGIASNSVFLDFEVMFERNRVELFRCGHIYLTDEDQRKSHLVMASLKKICAVYSVTVEKLTWMRPVNYKTLDGAVKKLTDFSKKVHGALEHMTDGYPYKRLTKNIYAI